MFNCIFEHKYVGTFCHILNFLQVKPIKSVLLSLHVFQRDSVK